MAESEKILYVNYEMFGAKGDGVTDDMEAIKAAHEYANEHKIDVKTDPFATYYIGPRPITAVIKTNVDFSTSKFIIDDREVKIEERTASVFKVVSEKEPIKFELPSLKKNQMKIDVTFPCNCYVKVVNDNKKQFIRFGLNVNNGSSQTDCFVCDRTGYILNKVIWDFEEVTQAIAYPIDERILTVKGGIFTTIANQAESKYNYHSRNIAVIRSNTVVENVTHFVEGELDHGAPYGSFIGVSNCAYVTVRNCHLTARKIYVTIGRAGKPVSMGSYAFNAGSVVNLRLENIKQHGIMDNTRWGLMATNHCKDLYVENCVMSRYDAHENVANLTIKNTVLGHQCFNAIGHGIMVVENVTAYGNSFLNLRGDYGSTWDGDIIFKNNTWYPRATANNPSFIGGSNAGDHDFGYNCYLPHKIDIDGLLICDGNGGPDYNGACLFDTSKMNHSGAPDYKDNTVAHPYFFTEKVTLKNIRTESGKGFKIFNGDTARCYALKKSIVSDDHIKCNFTVDIEDVEMADAPLIPKTALSPEDYGESYHVVPKIRIKDCENVNMSDGSMVPHRVTLIDSYTKGDKGDFIFIE